MRQAGYAGVSRREWLSRFTAREYAELKAYRRLEPVGFERLDYYFAAMVASVKNVLVTKAEDLTSRDDELLFYRPEAERKQKIADDLAVRAAQLEHWARLTNAMRDQQCQQ